MTARPLAFLLSAIAATAVAQNVRDDDPHRDLLRLTQPPPLLTFVSPDASLVARPDEVRLDSKPNPTPAPLRVRIEAASEREGTPTTSFRSSTPDIFVRWHGENLPVGATVRVAWVAEDVGDVVEPGFVVDQSETTVATSNFGARFTLSRPRDGWAPGKYRVDLFLEDELKDTLGITIRD